MANDTLARLSASELPRLLLRLWKLLHPRRRRQFLVLSLLMVLSAFAEVLTLGALVPFIAVLVEPERVLRYGPIAHLAQVLGIGQPDQLVLPLAVLFILGVVGASVLRITVVWLTTRLAETVGADLSTSAFERTLHQPFNVHLGRNSSEIISGLVQKVDNIAVGILAPCQSAFGSILTIAAVVAALIIIDPPVAIFVVVSFGGGYLGVTRAFRRRLKSNSERIATEQPSIVRIIQESIGGIREVLIDGTQAVFLGQFQKSDWRMRRARGSNNVIQLVPRIVMESVAMLVTALLAIFISRRVGGIAGSLPVLGALALGGQRLLPLGQQCYFSVTTVLGNHSLLVDALSVLEQPLPSDYLSPVPAAIGVTKSIECKHVRFRYSSSGPWVINDLDLTITAGTQIGLVGMTGCGKSTLLDIIMGLLLPCQGVVLVDGQRLEGDYLRAWQQSIAHVPQHVFLADTSLAKNIAFGVPAEEIVMDRVREAAQRAMINEFIVGEPAGYETVVGERGIRLSGGQRQRIGIARALYKQANILVLDEATSALDNQTEKLVIQSLAKLGEEVTVVLVAHRLTTLRDCDQIVEISDGRVANVGTYEGLMLTSDSFKDMALAADKVR